MSGRAVEDEALAHALAEMAREGRRRNWWNRYGDVLSGGFADLIELESKAISLHTWETILVPGLLSSAYRSVPFCITAPSCSTDRGHG